MGSSAAKYIGIFETLRSEILNGKYVDRERFPSEEMLVPLHGTLADLP